MYVFSRKKNEQLVIGDDVFVTVVEIRGDKVRLGIENPREMPVHRKEVYEAILRSMPGSAPATVPAAAPPQIDKVAQLAAALQARLGVAVSRDTVARSLREAGIDA
jgi:carbon storage regulator